MNFFVEQHQVINEFISKLNEAFDQNDKREYLLKRYNISLSNYNNNTNSDLKGIRKVLNDVTLATLNEITKLQQSINDFSQSLKNKYPSLQDPIQYLNEQIAEKELIIEKKTNQINQLQIQVSNSEQEKDKLDQINANLNEEISSLKCILEQEIISKEKTYEKYDSQLKDQKQKIKEIEKENQLKLSQISESVEGKKKENTSVPKKEESVYGQDIIIQMQSIKDLQGSNFQNQSRGLRVEQYNKDLSQTLKNVMIVGILGQKNMGKSFILNSLIDKNFPCNFHQSTSGISLKYHSLNQRNIIYLGSEGFNNPITMDQDANENQQKFMKSQLIDQKIDFQSEQNLQKILMDRRLDRKATESIQQEFIIENSDILLIVVSQITLEDQKLILSLQKNFDERKCQNRDRQVIIVHNIKDFCRPEYIQEYMEKIKKLFPVQQSADRLYDKEDKDENSIVFIESLNNNIHHVVMGHQQSEAGRIYNRFALYYIKNLIGMYQGISDFNFQDQFKDYLNKHLENYVVISKQTDEQDQDPDKQQLIYFNEEKQALMLCNGVFIDKVKDFQVNIFESIQKECQYSIVDKFEQKNGVKVHYRFLLIETPGQNTILKKYEKKNRNFIVQFQQLKDIEERLGQLHTTTRNFDHQTFNIKICNNNELWRYIENDENILEDKNIIKVKGNAQQNGIQIFTFIKEEEDYIE